MNRIISCTELQNIKILNLLGLAMKSASLAIGMDASRIALEQGDIKLLVLAADISEKSFCKIKATLEGKNIPTISISNVGEIGSFLGREKIAIVGVLDENIARGILKIVNL